MNYASACVLSYNRPEFLKQCITTLTANANYPLELIIHDDGSTDPEVWKLLDIWARAGTVSTIIRNPPGHNQGQGVALNRMFDIASGDPIIKLDQDLVFFNNWLSDLINIFNQNEHDCIDKADPAIGLLGLFKYYHDPVDCRKTKIEEYNLWQAHSHICGSGFAIPREAWEQFSPFTEYSDAFAEDWEMQMRITNSESWVCGLPNIDLVSNQGFGIPRSTVVNKDMSVTKIHKTPWIISHERY
jgi:glycosyltransferase involved in cell wall biosynthesis